MSVVVVGNKADLEDMRVVPVEAATQVCPWLATVLVRSLNRNSFPVCISELQNTAHRDKCTPWDERQTSFSHAGRKLNIQSQYISTRRGCMFAIVSDMCC